MSLSQVLSNGIWVTRLKWSQGTALVLLLAASPATGQGQLWISHAGTNLWEEPQAVAPDGSGGVYVCGFTFGSLGGSNAGGSDAWLARYDSAGNQLWIRQFGTNQLDYAWAAAMDGAGGVYLSGSTNGSLGGPSAGGADAWIARYDGAGNKTWIRQFGSGGHDNLWAAERDEAGGVYVSGDTDRDIGGYQAGVRDAWLGRYDSAGSQLWVRQLGTTANDSASAAAVDGAGGVYITGGTEGSLGGPKEGVLDAWLARYDFAGNRIWVRQLGTVGYDYANCAAADGSGGVYVSGVTGGSLGGPNAGSYDIWLARYSSAGDSLWIRQLGTTASDSASAAAADGSGGVYIGGYTQGTLAGPTAGSEDACFARYDGGGHPLWIQQIGTIGMDFAFAATTDDAGSLYLSGSTTGSLGGPHAGFTDIWLARYDGSCNSGETYCVASSTSIPNCQAAIGGSGSPTLADPTAFTISSGSVPGANLGLLLFGSSGPASTSYGTLGGMLCVAAPTFRTTPKLSGGDQDQCNGVYSFTLQDVINASPIVTSGATINAQVWARDPANSDGFLLSDGIEFTVCP